MVKGLAAVKWTAENNHKLLQAVALIHTGTLDYKKLASVFGPDVPVKAISHHFFMLRKEGTALGICEGTGTSTGRKRSDNSKSKVSTSEDVDDEEGMNTDEALSRQLDSASARGTNKLSASKTSKKTQKVINGRVTKARKSPRAAIKKDYIALGDPFGGSSFMNSDGEKIFPTDRSSSDDSFASDKGYDAKDEDGQEMEEGV